MTAKHQTTPSSQVISSSSRRTLAVLLLAAITLTSACSTPDDPAPDPYLPTTKLETIETMNGHLRLLLEGIMYYQTAPVPPQIAPQGVIRRDGCVQGNTDYLEGPPWKYTIDTGDVYTPEKERLIAQRVHDLAETGWRIVRDPKTHIRKQWSIVNEQNFVLVVELPSDDILAERPPKEVFISVTSMSPCVNVEDNDR